MVELSQRQARAQWPAPCRCCALPPQKESSPLWVAGVEGGHRALGLAREQAVAPGVGGAALREVHAPVNHSVLLVHLQHLPGQPPGRLPWEVLEVDEENAVVHWGVDLTEGRAPDPWRNGLLSGEAKRAMAALHARDPKR